MRWRQVGPFRAGRISAVAGIPGDPAIYYLGTPGGGIWKSTSGGTTWKPIFDETRQESIGSIAIARSNPDILYVGTGDVSSVEKSMNIGNGVWKSVDNFISGVCSRQSSPASQRLDLKLPVMMLSSSPAASLISVVSVNSPALMPRMPAATARAEARFMRR